MPGFTPGRRWQPAFRPFRRERLARRLLAGVERATKGPAFGCRMCGNCLLQETAFICPMECPKGLRNGPCGGATERCYVDPSRPCIWNAIYERAFRLEREEKLMEVLPPLDWSEVGTETWGDVARSAGRMGFGTVLRGLLSRRSRAATLDWVFRPVRQPDWWQGDDRYHAPAYDPPASGLERALRAGEFVVTTEMRVPLGSDVGRLEEDIAALQDHVVAMNFTDGASARVRMSSQASSLTALRMGSEPVLQIAAREVTRTGLQAQAMGAAALGITNILVISGDSPAIGLAPAARLDWLDVDAVQMLWILRRMRDDAILLDGRTIDAPPTYFLGAAASPFASSPRIQAMREHKKVNAGAQFLQTNLVFDAAGLDPWLEELAHRDVLDKVFILAGVAPLISMRMAEYLNTLPGISVPARVLDRLHAADDVAEEGFRIALELVEGLRQKEGISGIHLTATGRPARLVRLLTEAGLTGTTTQR